MALLKHLGGRVETKYIKPDLINIDGLGMHVFVLPQSVEMDRHKDLHDERAITYKQSGDVLEAAHLVSRLNRVLNTTKTRRQEPASQIVTES